MSGIDVTIRAFQAAPDTNQLRELEDTNHTLVNFNQNYSPPEKHRSVRIVPINEGFANSAIVIDLSKLPAGTTHLVVEANE